METKLSSKGQVVLPHRARRKLGLRPGAKFACTIQKGSIVLTPKTPPPGKVRLVRSQRTGLMVTEGPPGFVVTEEQIKAALTDFP